jgi:hypothetical protein
MKRSALARAFAPHTSGRWFELESALGETRVRWVADGSGSDPRSLEIRVAHGHVDEIVLGIGAAAAKPALATLGIGDAAGLASYEGPSGRVIVAAGGPECTIRLVARQDAGR